MVKHIGTKKLETERLILRRFALGDGQYMFNNWASDPEVTKHMTWPAHTDVSVSEKVIDCWINGYEDEAFYQWAIVWKESNEPIGSISVVEHCDRTEKATVGYCIGKKWWHQGITSEALAAVLEYLFDEVGVNRVEAQHDVRNPHSGGVMRKCGMQYEGTLRQYGLSNMGLCDICVYGILKSDRPK